MSDVIPSVPVAYVSNANFATAVKQLHADHLATLDAEAHTDLLRVVSAIAVLIAGLDGALARSRVSAITAAKVEADALRDRLTVFGVEHIRNQTRHFAEEQRLAAERLAAIIAKRPGSFQLLGYDANTHELDSLLNDLATPEAAADLETVGLTDWRAQLQAAATTFEQVRAEERVLEATEDGPALYPTKRALVRRFRLLFDFTEFYAEEGLEPFPALLERSRTTVEELLRYRDLPEPSAPDAA